MGFLKGLFKGSGHTIEELARRLDVSLDQLQSIDLSYRTVEIPKRRGGTRKLAIPNDALKDLQRRILRRLLKRLRAHPRAMGFEGGKSVADHARLHVGKAVVVSLDVRDFFTATKVKRIARYFREIGWNREAAALLTKLTTHNGGLPQGAPTSPRLSNLVNRRLDAELSRFARKRGIAYSRYADDMTFSFTQDDPKLIHLAIRVAKARLDDHGYALHTKRKLHIRRRHQRQVVTGLVVNDGVRLPREARRWMRAVLHHRETNRPATLTTEQLAGWKGYLQMLAAEQD